MFLFFFNLNKNMLRPQEANLLISGKDTQSWMPIPTYESFEHCTLNRRSHCVWRLHVHPSLVSPTFVGMRPPLSSSYAIATKSNGCSMCSRGAGDSNIFLSRTVLYWILHCVNSVQREIADSRCACGQWAWLHTP